MANSAIDFNPDLLYRAPEILYDGDIEYVQFDSIAGNQSYAPNANLNFQLRSQQFEGIDINKSTINFDFTQTGTAVAMSALGVSSVFKSVTDTLSGKQLPTEDVGLFRLLDLATDSAERKAITATCELYGAARPSTNVTDTFSVAMPLITTLSSMTKILPLMALTGGWNINYQLASLTDVLPTKTVGTWAITNVRIIAALVKPVDSYLRSLTYTLQNGGALNIPLQIKRDSGTINLNSSLQQSIRVSPGFYSSVNSMTLFQRSTSGDKFISNTATLKNYFINVNSQRYPRNFSIKANSADNLYMFLSPMGSACGSLAPFVDTTSGVCRYSWKSSSSFNQGIPIRDGSLSIQAEFNSTPEATTANIIFEIDAILRITQADVDLITNFE